MSDEPARLASFHERTFPNGSLIPSSIRAINPRRIEAAFMNALSGVKPEERDPKALLEATVANVKGDESAKLAVRQLLEGVWFRPNSGIRGRSGQELLITHVQMGRHFRPAHHYGIDKWVPAILDGAGLTPSESEALGRIFHLASARPLNLVEDSICGAIASATPPMPAEPAARLPMAHLVGSFGGLVRNLIRQGSGGNLDEVEAERIALDILSILRTALYVLWNQYHLTAYEAILAFESGNPAAKGSKAMPFGYETERSMVNKRPFGDTRDQLSLPLERGDYAIMALIQAHKVFKFEADTWFDEVPDRKLGARELQVLERWYNDYAAAATATGVKKDRMFLPDKSAPNLRRAIFDMYETLWRNHKELRPEEGRRSQYTSTVGGLTNMAAADDGRLFLQLGRGHGLGLHAMVDARMVLLLARGLMKENRRTPLQKIRHELEEWGVVLDDESFEELTRDLERRGHLQRLSDSGESIYVRID